MVKVIADSTCDLSDDLLKKYDISIIPLHILLGDREYCDGKDITPDDIYDWADRNNSTPKTSAPSIEDVIAVFKEYVEQNCEIVSFSISSEMSTSNNVMKLAASELDAEDSIHIIDSANLSTGIGLLVIEAAVMAQAGHNADEIEKYINSLKLKVRASFVVDTLVYLHRGGRCSGLAAIAGSALKLHPKIIVENGKMVPGKKYRGKMDRVTMDYVKDLDNLLANAKKDRVFITHSGCDEQLIKMVIDFLEKLNRFDEILVTRAGGVISSHCGPGTLGVLFIEE